MNSPLLKLIDRKTENFIPAGTALHEPDGDSRIGRIVPEVIFTHGSRKHLYRDIIRVFPQMVRAIKNRSIAYRDLRKNPPASETGITADDGFFRELEAFARELGCNDIGYTKVPRRYVFSNYKTLTDNAIIITMAMDKDEIAKTPSIKAGREIWRTYDQLGFIVNRVAGFLRDRGFAAQAGTPLGGEAIYPLLAQKAGLGYIGKLGVLISPDLGPCQRIAVVYTSIENLPFSDSDEHSWIADFCESCNKCVRKCPAGAIYETKPVMKDGGPRHIDYIKCAMPFSKSMGCSVCISECVFFREDYKKIKMKFL